MELSVGLFVAIACLEAIMIQTVYGIDPHHLERAKILDSADLDEIDGDASGFTASAQKCRKIGEKAAKKRISCIAETDFMETLANRVHMSRIIPSEDDKELWDIAHKISKCALHYSKYFEHACRMRSTYLEHRRRCRRLRSRQDRTRCKGELHNRYHRRH